MSAFRKQATATATFGMGRKLGQCAPAGDLRSRKHTLHQRLLATSALVPVMLAVLDATPAVAQCTIVGGGTINNLASNAQATCVGANIPTVGIGGNNVSVTFGNGATPTSSTPGTHGLVSFDPINSSIIVTSGATVSGSTWGISLEGLSPSNNTITMQAGGTVHGNAPDGGGIYVGGVNATNNVINVAGQVTTGGGTVAIHMRGSQNQVNVASGGVVNGVGGGITFSSSGANAGGNVITNAGTISSSYITIWDQTAGDTLVVNSGTISGGSIAAIGLGGGNDILELRAGSVITGKVFGGTGIDTLRLGGATNAAFNLDTFGAGKQFDQFETLRKIGTSAWTLTGTTTWNGGTVVSEGTLIVNGSLANSNVILDGGSLGGTGTVGSSLVKSGATIAPGNSIGTINVNGNVQFNAGSTYQAEIDGAGTSDKIAATGTATLNGGTVQIIPLGTGFKANTQYTILTANGGVTGTFATLDPLPLPLVAGVLQYDPNNVFFLLQQVEGFASLASLSNLTPNQKAVAGALDAVQAGGGASAALTNAINTLAAKSTAGILAGLDDLAGQSLADAHRFATLQGAGFHRFVGSAASGWGGDVTRFSFGGAGSFAPPMQLGATASAPRERPSAREASTGYAGWFGAWGSWDRIDRSASTFGVNANAGGAAAGLELRGTHTTVGAAIGGSSGRLRTAGRNDSVESEMGNAALYARHRWAGFEFDTAASLGYAWLDSSRSIAFLGQTARAEQEALTTGLSLRIARPFGFGGFTATPFAALDWFTAHRGSFGETGAAGVDQLVASSTDSVLQGSAGLQLGYRSAFANGLPWAMATRFAVRHDFDGGAPTMRTSLEGAPGVPFVISGADYERTAFIAGAQLDAALSPASTWRLGYDGDFSRDRVSHSVRGGVQVRF